MLFRIKTAYKFIVRNKLQNLIIFLAITIGISVQFFVMALSTVINKTIIDSLTTDTYHLRILVKTRNSDDHMKLMNDDIYYIISFDEVENYTLRQGKNSVISTVDLDGNVFVKPLRIFLTYDSNDLENYLTFYGINNPNNLVRGRLNDPDNKEIMLIDDLAKEYKIDIGDVVTISSPFFVNTHETFTLVGTYETKSYNATNNYIYLPLGSVEIFRLGNYHIDITIKDPMKVNEFISKLDKFSDEEKYTFYPWDETNKDFLSIDKLQRYVITAVIIAISFVLFIVILNMLNYMIQKKYSEIGILKAMGLNESDTRRIFTIQTALITVISLLFGLTTGNIWATLYSNYMKDPVTKRNRFYYDMTSNHYLLLILSSFIVSYLASVYSYRKTVSLKTIDLIKK